MEKSMRNCLTSKSEYATLLASKQVEGGFPTSHTNGWVNENGFTVAYVYDNKIYFHEKNNPKHIPTICLPREFLHTVT